MFLFHIAIMNLFTNIIFVFYPHLQIVFASFLLHMIHYKCFIITFRTSHLARGPFSTETAGVKLLCMTVSISSSCHPTSLWIHYHCRSHQPTPISLQSTPYLPPPYQSFRFWTSIYLRYLPHSAIKLLSNHQPLQLPHLQNHLQHPHKKKKKSVPRIMAARLTCCGKKLNVLGGQCF